MTNRRDAALKKLEGQRERPFLRLRWALLNLTIITFGGLGIICSGIVLVVLVCVDEGIVCLQKVWATSGASLNNTFSGVLGFVVLLLSGNLGLVLGYKLALWLIGALNLITHEELSPFAGRRGIFVLSLKKSPAVTRHEIRN